MVKNSILVHWRRQTQEYMQKVCFLYIGKFANFAYRKPRRSSSLATGHRFVKLSSVTAWRGCVTKTEVVVCVMPKLQRLLSKEPCSPGRKVAHWLKGWERDTILRLFSPANPLMHIMVQPDPKTECRFWTGVRSHPPLTTIKSCNWT